VNNASENPAGRDRLRYVEIRVTDVDRYQPRFWTSFRLRVVVPIMGHEGNWNLKLLSAQKVGIECQEDAVNGKRYAGKNSCTQGRKSEIRCRDPPPSVPTKFPLPLGSGS